MQRPLTARRRGCGLLEGSWISPTEERGRVSAIWKEAGEWEMLWGARLVEEQLMGDRERRKSSASTDEGDG